MFSKTKGLLLVLCYKSDSIFIDMQKNSQVGYMMNHEKIALKKSTHSIY